MFRRKLFPVIALLSLCVSTAQAQCHLFFTDPVAKKVYSLAHNTGSPQAIISGLQGPRDIDIDLTHQKLFFADDSGNIYRSNLDGSSLETLVSGLDSPKHVVLDLPHSKLYWSAGSSSGTIGRANLDGTGAQTYATTPGVINGLSLTPGDIEWSEAYQNSARRRGCGLTSCASPYTRQTAAGSTPPSVTLQFVGHSLHYFNNYSNIWAVERRDFVAMRSTTLYYTWSGAFAGYLNFALNDYPAPGLIVATSASDLDYADNFFYFTDSDARPAVHRGHINATSQNFITPEGSFSPFGVAVVPTSATSICSSLAVASSSPQEATIWRPSNGGWYMRRPIRNFNRAADSFVGQWGLPTDAPLLRTVLGLEVLTVWRQSEGNWYDCALQGQNTESQAVGAAYCAVQSTQFGLFGDYPLVVDFDLDNIDDLVVWRPADGTWYIKYSTNAHTASFQWGLQGDLPVPADYDGDGTPDLAVWRPSAGTWFIRYSSEGYRTDRAATRQWGLANDHPIPGDFTGDGKADLAVWRPENGTWYICNFAASSDCSQNTAVQWGLPGDSPIGQDFDGDGRSDYVVWRPAFGLWFFRSSANDAVIQQQWGLPGDVPLVEGIRDRVMRLYGSL